MKKIKINKNNVAIKNYYNTLYKLSDLHIFHETAVKVAFQNVLENYSKQIDCNLVLEWKMKSKHNSKKNISVDGAIITNSRLVVGYWEAKDKNDDLDKEINKKIKDGYPLDNIIFQSPERVVIYQENSVKLDIDLKDPQNLVDAIKIFLEYTHPEYEEWEESAKEFGSRVSDIGKALLLLIDKELLENLKFKKSFDNFNELCKKSINPDLSRDAIKEMLIQHILTIRLFRKIFNNPDFTNRNIIAKEIEILIADLTSRKFDRESFLQPLDRFYLAIEKAALTIQDFHQKQDFLNYVYETFFQGFSVKVADTHGIVYTPQPIVNFMVRSVEKILNKEFNLSLSSPNVNILDPFVGTGNFVLNILNFIKKSVLKEKYEKEIHCNEILLLPYYIASINIEHLYFERMNEYIPFEGICLADTFEITNKKYSLTKDNIDRVNKQNESPIFVVISNPPYNAKQANENDNNKNRKYYELDKRISETYAKESKAKLKRDLYDVYVKAFRWASDRIGDNGVIAFITNNSFLDDKAFDGMRKLLREDFTKIFVLDLKGNIRRDSMRDGIPLGEKHTVFGLSAMVGISITFLIKNKENKKNEIFYESVDFRATREEKFKILENLSDIYSIDWSDKMVKENNFNTWITEGFEELYSNYPIMGHEDVKVKNKIDENVIFLKYSLGVSSNRSAWVYSFLKSDLEKNMKEFIDSYNTHVYRYSRQNISNVDEFVDYSRIKWSSTLKSKLRRGIEGEFDSTYIRNSEYRPFTRKYIYFDSLFIDRPGLYNEFFPNITSEQENIIIAVVNNPQSPFSALATNCIPDLAYLGRDVQTFPLYIYDSNERKDNLSDSFFNRFKLFYKDDSVSKFDIFSYIYSVLNHKEYKNKYKINLNKEIPRIPFLKDYKEYIQIGKKLLNLHAYYQENEDFRNQKEYFLSIHENEKEDFSYRTEQMKVLNNGSIIVYNNYFKVVDIPIQCYEFKIGNRSAINWFVDQYKVSTDEKSGLVSDPNNINNEKNILDSLLKIIYVSYKTIDLVNSLPKFKVIN